MRVYFDTSVLVAAVVESHPSNVQAAAAIRSAHAKEIQAFTSTHGLSEMYSVLTRLPLRPAIYPADALHASAAQKAECERLYTLNLKHFQELTGRWADRVRTP